MQWVHNMSDTVYFGSKDEPLLLILLIGGAVYLAMTGHNDIAILIIGAMLFIEMEK